MMNEKRSMMVLLVLTVALLLLSILAEMVYFSDFEYRFRTDRFNKVLGEKEKVMEDCLSSLKPILARGEGHGSLSENNIFSLAEQHKITILAYVENTLVTWSDNGFDVPLSPDDSLFSKTLVFIQNGWFLPKKVQTGNETLIGLLRIYTDYGFENDLIKNGFEKDFRLPRNTRLNPEKGKSEFHIFNNEGRFLFSLLFPEERVNTTFIIIPILLWVASFVFSLFLIMALVRFFIRKGHYLIAVAVCFLIFLLIYSLIILTGKPAIFSGTELFLPYGFTLNRMIPSLGHLLILSILLSVFSYVFYMYFPLKRSSEERAGQDNILLTLFFIPGAMLFLGFHIIFSRLVFTSNINFETFKVLDLNELSIAGFGSILLLFTVPLFYLLKTFRILNQLSSKSVIRATLISIVVFVAVYYARPGVLIPLSLFYFIIVTGMWISERRKAGLFNRIVILSLVLGLYSLYLITTLSEQKITENLKIQTVTYSTENDPEAEHLLIDLWPEMENDTLLSEMINVEYFGRDDVEEISEYLHETYFNGYLANFNFKIVLCRSDELLRIGQVDATYKNCFDFFEERIRQNGHLITGTQFYFLDNQGGRSYYLGKLIYRISENIRNGLFIELYSDINVFQPGYSELLLDKTYGGYTKLKDHSFVKYINGEIVLITGDFPYDKTDTEYVDKSTDYRQFTQEGFKHVLYKNGNVTVILGRPVLTFGNLIISFAYLFVFIFLVSNLILLLIHRPALIGAYNFNFRQKLQVSFVGVLLFSFLLIGIVTASFIIRQYETKHHENLKEKMNSIYIELDNKISLVRHLTPEWSNETYSSLNEVLIKLSNIFNTDINLYDLNGYLLATSRHEIYYRNLISTRMNIMAFNNLEILTRSEYFQKEKIGSLEYISAYIPFYNAYNELLIYLNLPYFRMQSVLAEEISNLVVAVINFTLLLIVITMSLAVFISSRLTSPLTMLSKGLASVELGKKSEHLSYQGSDEIGELVKQYNRMLDELEESARKLTASERDYAWREMAKQIAHEIKNPLTPMKLNVQQLLKSWQDEVPGFEKKLEKFSKNQIEYINNLSSIASAFSAFAKMPEIRPVEVDLLEQIKTTLELFKNTDNITFRIGWPHERRIFVYADKEHLNGVFSNLIKNGIQSIPPGREGIIKVSIEVRSNRVIISIADNGTGIPELLQNKMFTPNFTTKSSGMGLGLSIVKKYVESANGRIWFESETNKGSVFYIEYPLMYTVENWDRPYNT